MFVLRPLLELAELGDFPSLREQALYFALQPVSRARAGELLRAREGVAVLLPQPPGPCEQQLQEKMRKLKAALRHYYKAFCRLREEQSRSPATKRGTEDSRLSPPRSSTPKPLAQLLTRALSKDRLCGQSCGSLDKRVAAERSQPKRKTAETRERPLQLRKSHQALKFALRVREAAGAPRPPKRGGG